MKNLIIASLSLLILVLSLNLVNKSREIDSLSSQNQSVLITTYHNEELLKKDNNILELKLHLLELQLNDKTFMLDMATNRIEQLNLELGL